MRHGTQLPRVRELTWPLPRFGRASRPGGLGDTCLGFGWAGFGWAGFNANTSTAGAGTVGLGLVDHRRGSDVEISGARVSDGHGRRNLPSSTHQ
jgi:hypothetical protein